MEERRITQISPKEYERVESPANKLGFHLFCHKVERALQKKDPMDKVMNFFDQRFASSLQPGPASLYPILKLMFPSEVIRTYNMQVFSLAQLYIHMVPLPENGKDANRLLYYNNPDFNTGPFTGDFGGTLEDVLKSRIGTTPSTLTLGNVDSLLTQISESNAEERRTLFRGLNLSPTEHKFLVRIMLDKLRLGFSIHTVLKIFNDDCVIQRYDMSQNLRRICAEFALHNKVDTPRLELLQPFQVHLSARVSSLDNVLTRMKTSFVMDRKIDGDRYVVHKQGPIIKLFSRACREASAGYYNQLKPTLLQQIQVEECILDGEVVEWDETLGRHANFGTNRTAAADNSDTLMFIAYDVVYVGGEGLVLKSMDGTYLFGSESRSQGSWFKVKPDYVNMAISDLDLIILGMYYGTNGDLTHYLVGLKDVDEYASSLRILGSVTDDLSLRRTLSMNWPQFKK